MACVTYLPAKWIDSSPEDNQETVRERTDRMNTPSYPAKGTRTIHVHIVDVVEQKGGGYTVVLQALSDEDITSEETWRVALPGNFKGATRVDRLWHLYYGTDPGYSPGQSLEVSIPNEEKAV